MLPDDLVIEIYSHLGRPLDLNRILRSRQKDADSLTHRRFFGEKEATTNDLRKLFKRFHDSENLDMMTFLRRRYHEIRIDHGSKLRPISAYLLSGEKIDIASNQIVLDLLRGNDKEVMRQLEDSELGPKDPAFSFILTKAGNCKYDYLDYFRDYFRRHEIPAWYLAFLLVGILQVGKKPLSYFEGVVTEIMAYSNSDSIQEGDLLEFQQMIQREALKRVVVD